MVTAQEVNHFWLNEVEPEAWYKEDPDLDKQIIGRFLEARNLALAGDLDDWQDTAEGTLALLILLDQFSRNMFRGDGRSFASDPKARALARTALEKDFDLAVEERARNFFYLPFMHSEDMADQDFGIEVQRNRGITEEGLLHAIAHRRIIEKFGRFPFRNKALGRKSSEAEETFLNDGGYRAIVEEIEGKSGDS